MVEKKMAVAHADAGPEAAVPPKRQVKRNLFSFITVSWITPLLVQGSKAPLQEKDLYELIPFESFSCLYFALLD
eukprot:jgi/Hompol1/494/HPOL_003920-RA